MNDDNLWFHGVQITHTKFLDKLRNLLVIIRYPKTKYGIIDILKYTSDLSNVISIESPETLRVLRIYQCCSK